MIRVDPILLQNIAYLTSNELWSISIFHAFIAFLSTYQGNKPELLTCFLCHAKVYAHIEEIVCTSLQQYCNAESSHSTEYAECIFAIFTVWPDAVINLRHIVCFSPFIAKIQHSFGTECSFLGIRLLTKLLHCHPPEMDDIPCFTQEFAC